MQSPSITIYGTNEELCPEAIQYHMNDLNGHPLPHHQREFHTMLVALTDAGGIPTPLLRRYGKIYEVYCDVTTGEQKRTAMQKAVKSALFDLGIDVQPVLEQSRTILDAA